VSCGRQEVGVGNLGGGVGGWLAAVEKKRLIDSYDNTSVQLNQPLGGTPINLA
jgi:hypothetical protein